jgi:hypothetical protein
MYGWDDTPGSPEPLLFGLPQHDPIKLEPLKYEPPMHDPLIHEPEPLNFDRPNYEPLQYRSSRPHSLSHPPGLGMRRVLSIDWVTR